ncbi:MAG: hypothetical protein ABJA10_00115 [Aestuariivirga sp.]
MTLDQILTNMALLQRDDGALANSTVGVVQLDGVLISLGFSRPTTWLTATSYPVNSAVFQNNILYVCLVAHTSGTFATDLAALKWVLAVDFNAVITPVQTYANSAQAYAAAAQASAVSSAASFTTFDKRWLGPKAADPIVDNQGAALAAGAGYFNTVSGQFKIYSGSVWFLVAGATVGYLVNSNNLSEVTNAATARTNINAASLGANTIVGNQTITGIVTVTGNVTASGDTTIGGQIRGNGVMSVKEQTVTYAATIALDPTIGADAVVTMTGGMAVNPIVNQINIVGAGGQLRLIQDGTGGRAVTWDTTFVMSNGMSPSISTAANAETVFNYKVKAASGVGSVVLSPRPVAPGPHVIIEDQKTSGTNGGGSISGIQTRVLNTVVQNNGNLASLSSNQITLSAGTYLVTAKAQANSSGSQRLALYNVTDAVVALAGLSSFSVTSNTMEATLSGILTITAAKVFELRHFTSTSVGTTGLGSAVSNFGVEIYSRIEITKLN